MPRKSGEPITNLKTGGNGGRNLLVCFWLFTSKKSGRDSRTAAEQG